MPSEHIKFLPNKKNISNAILVLDPITMKDRGNFICSGKNSVVFEPVNSAASYVRIKGNKLNIRKLMFVLFDWFFLFR